MTIGPVGKSAYAFLAVNNDPDILWNAAEWSWYEGGEYFDIPYRMLLSRSRDERERETMPFHEFRAGVIEASVRALEELDTTQPWQKQARLRSLHQARPDPILIRTGKI